ncbi:transposase [Simiduia aestuariiviva]|uniref:Transposase-like protein n=1 Tax=Simiduia aestuariiviva TaxID=1510459 RepID=A0A839UGB0_9GAMM|nr:transposase-like protein [Simiduia aestuariiviva]
MPKYNNPRKTWQYSTEFKIRAVKMSYQPDIQIKQVAEGLGIHPFMLSRWRKEYRDGLLQGTVKSELIKGSQTLAFDKGLLLNFILLAWSTL